MLYFPIINSTWPDWMPLIGGREFTFFSPVFNIADSYITVAVFYIILFQRKFSLNKDRSPLRSFSSQKHVTIQP